MCPPPPPTEHMLPEMGIWCNLFFHNPKSLTYVRPRLVWAGPVTWGVIILCGPFVRTDPLDIITPTWKVVY